MPPRKPDPIHRRSTYQIRELLTRYSADGKALEHVSKLLGRSTTTLRRYARQLSLSFSDYTPRGVKKHD